MPQPASSIIPAGIWWVRDVAHAAEKNFIGMPGIPGQPKKFWRDDAAVVSGAWWSAPATSKSYKMLARNADGSLKLAKINSPEFYATYTSISVVRTYQQYSFLFTDGVPYLVDVVMPTETAASLNFIGADPAMDYPRELWANHMLDARTGVVQVWDYQEFARFHAVPAGVSDAERRVAIKRIVDGPGTDAAVIQAVREIVTVSGNGNTQLT